MYVLLAFSREDVLRATSQMIQGLLLDLAGVLHVGDVACPGAIEAVAAVRASGLPVRYVTNTTRKTRAVLIKRLRQFGFDVRANEVFTAPHAARAYCRRNNLRPFMLVHPDLRPDLEELETDAPNAVLVADAGDAFTYAALNQAFRLLAADTPLIAVARNRYFRDGKQLSLDAGPFVAALEYAAGVEARLIGKPAPEFFIAAVTDMGLIPENVAMIGDDVEADVCGAVGAGLAGVLVRTGKYRQGDEDRLPAGARVAADVRESIDMILSDLSA